MSFLSDFGQKIERDYVELPEQWRDIVNSFPAQLKERYYEKFIVEGIKVVKDTPFSSRKEAVVKHLADEVILAQDIITHILQTKVGLSKETALSLAVSLVGTEKQFGETIGMLMDGKYIETAQSALLRTVENAEFNQLAIDIKKELNKNKPDHFLSWEGLDWGKKYGIATVFEYAHWNQAQKMEQAVKEISQKKPDIITGFISGEISKRMPNLNNQENKCLTDVLLTAVTAENPKDFGEKMSKLMKQGQNSKMMQDIAQKQFGLSIGDLAAVAPHQWERHADWVMKSAGTRDFAQLRRHAIIKSQNLVNVFIREIGKNPDMVSRVAKQIAPDALASIDSRFLSGLIGIITQSKTPDECVTRMDKFLDDPKNKEQMNNLLKEKAGNNADYLKSVTPQQWKGIISTMSEKQGSFDKLKAHCIFKRNDVLKEFVGHVKNVCVKNEISQGIKNGIRQLGSFFNQR